MTRSEKKFKVG